MKKTISFVLVLVLGLATVSPATEDTWTYKTDMPTGRGFTSGTVVDGKIYVIGGFPSHYSVTPANEMYDPTTDTWTRMADMPSGRCGHATCAYDGKIYVFGGVSPDGYSSARKNVYVYDPQTDSWTQEADMPYANAFCGIAVVNDTIYLIGGTTKLFSPPISTVMAYDPVTETWTQKANMPTARASLSASVLDGKIYTFGGADQNLRSYAYKSVEVYDPATNTWTTKTDMSTGLFGLGACAMNGKIYAVGGVTNGLRVVTTNKLYDPVTDTWTTKSPMHERRQTFFLGSVGDKIYAIGGSYPDPQGEPVMPTSVEEYDTGLGVPSPDFNGDGIVDSADMCMMIDYWGTDEPSYDIAPPPFGDGIIDVQDLIVLAEHLFYVYPWAETVEVNEDNDGGQVELELGKLLIVTLESNPSTGYRWERVENNESILKQLGQSRFMPSESGRLPKVGAGGWEIFRFKAVSAGQMTLELVYHRSWEDAEPLKTFSIQVNSTLIQ
ncbi:MAG: Kelch repeat-containing protein [Planctomycetota bacterium]|jgi:N-acetylneuraminic acid mutarotase/predicted secreted protein